MTALIFGISGQDGFYLSNLCKSKSLNVLGVSKSSGNWIQGDVSHYPFVESLIMAHKPNYIFNLAANSTTQHHSIFENNETIGTGTLNILESVRLHCPDSKVFIAGSAMQFENNGTPIDEHTPFWAGSPYAFSRIHSVYAGRYFREKFGIKVYIGYLFNHDSPLRTERHINKLIAKAAQQISTGSEQKLILGNIEVKKEFNFAGDIVEAIWILLQQNKIYEVVIGSGLPFSIKEWAKACFEFLNMNWQYHIEIDSSFVPEYSLLVSNPALISSLGWKPKISFHELVRMMMTDDKNYY